MTGLIDLLWSRLYEMEGPLDTPCWIYHGPESGTYGAIRFEGKRYKTHRLAYETWIGSIKEGYRVCHKCDMRKCCNPDHLFQGTDQDNMDDMIAKGRDVPLIGSMNGRATITEADVLEIRELLAKGVHSSSIYNKYAISRSTLYNIRHRRKWRHI